MKQLYLFLNFAALFLSFCAHAYPGKILKEFECPVAEPMDMTIQGDTLWLSDMATRTLVQLDGTGKILQRIPVDDFMPAGIAWHQGILYHAARWQDRIYRLEPATKSSLSPLSYYEKWPMLLTHDGQYLWVGDARRNKVHKIDPIDGTTIQSFPTPGKWISGLGFDGQYLWIADHKSNEIYRVDQSNGNVIGMIPSPGPYPRGIAIFQDTMWIADYQAQKIYQILIQDPTPYVEDEARRFQVSFDIHYQAQGLGMIKDLQVYLSIPQEIPGQHLLSPIQFSPKPDRIEKDQWGQAVAVFHFPKMENNEIKSVRWQGDFLLHRTRYQLRPENLKHASIPLSAKSYLGDDKKYDLNDTVIIDTTHKLLKFKTNYYERARTIYDFLTESITYERSGGWNNAATVLKRQNGSCSEYTFVLVALLRKAGIPARYVGAVAMRGDEASFDDVFHRWAEAYFPGYGWVPLDANAGYGKSSDKKGFYFGSRDNRHIITTIGGGNSTYLDWTYNHHQRYKTQGNSKLKIQPIARFRPLVESEEQPTTALVAATPKPRHVTSEQVSIESPCRSAPFTIIGSAALICLILGIVIGRKSK